MRIVTVNCLLLSGAGMMAAQKESPWLATPLLSSGPKMGTSLGAMGGYLHRFDSESPTSTFAMMGTYSNTDSFVTGLFARTFFGKNTHRLAGGVIYGRVNNEYNDFLGSGKPFSTTDEFYAAFTRYSYRIFDNWFLGGQFIATNYTISGGDAFSDAILEFIGLKGFESKGIGLTMEYDNRDNINSPSHGTFFNLNSVAYRKALGGSVNFDVYNEQLRHYIGQSKSWTLAMRFDSRWSVDAPPGGYSSTNLRGYTQGQYLAPNNSVLEAEERVEIAWGIGAVLFTGVDCLYNALGDCGDQSNLFPSIGGGLNYMIKPEEKMVVRLEGAKGEAENYGIYMQFGRAF